MTLGHHLEQLPAGTSLYSVGQVGGPTFLVRGFPTGVLAAIATLPSGASALFQIVARVDTPPGKAAPTPANVATVFAFTFDPTFPDNTAATITPIVGAGSGGGGDGGGGKVKK